MAQLLLYLPDELVARLRRAVPPRERSRFVQRLLEQALPPDEEDPLRRIALEVEQEERLSAEMAAWEEVTLADGLGGRR